MPLLISCMAWAAYLTVLCLSVLIWKVGLIITSPSCRAAVRIKWVCAHRRFRAAGGQLLALSAGYYFFSCSPNCAEKMQRASSPELATPVTENISLWFHGENSHDEFLWANFEVGARPSLYPRVPVLEEVLMHELWISSGWSCESHHAALTLWP